MRYLSNRQARMMAQCREAVKDESGQDLVEYALIVAAVALALITTVTQLSGAIGSLYGSIAGRLTGVDWSETK